MRLTKGCGWGMSLRMSVRLMEAVSRLEPKEAADRLLEARGSDDDEWLDRFTEHLDLRRAGRSLERTLSVWGLSQSEAARRFGVSRQAFGKWLERGPPAERASTIADLAAATDLLVHYLKRDRIPAVVRRGMSAVGGRSMLDLLGTGESRAILAACRDMFRFDRAHS